MRQNGAHEHVEAWAVWQQGRALGGVAGRGRPALMVVIRAVRDRCEVGRDRERIGERCGKLGLIGVQVL